MKTTVWVLLGIAILAMGSHFYFKQRNTRIAFSYLDQFQYIPSINCYEQGHPLSYFGGKKAKKAVLLLHGYGSSPSFFANLTEQMDRAGIPYYAPLMTGFALGDFHLLDVVQDTDWARDVLFGFDLLASYAEHVDVVGHSEGGCLAVLLTAQRDVNQLILVDPYLFAVPLPNAEDRLLKRLIETPILGNIVSFLCPVIEMPKYHLERMDVFGLKSVPLPSLPILWKTQKMAELSGNALKSWATSRGAETVFLLYGEKDWLIDIGKIVHWFQAYHIPIHVKEYPHSGHDLLIDYDWKEAVSDILDRIQNSSSGIVPQYTQVYRDRLKSSLSDCVKAPFFDDPEASCID